MKLLKINLQLFAESSGEKTEKATPKKREDARKEGNVFQSKEINGAATLLFAVALLGLMGNYMFKNMASSMERFFRDYMTVESLSGMGSVQKLMVDVGMEILVNILPMLLGLTVVGLAISYLQVGFLLNPIKVKFSKLNPISGFKNIFSIKSLFELVKSFLKIFVILYIVANYLKAEMGNINIFYELSLPQILAYVAELTYEIGIRICIGVLVLGIIDFAFQKFQYEKNLMMSKQEIKEEYKQMEGDPQIKSRIKQKQRELAMRRMMQDVPKADVIITNPTHFAVAVKYDKSRYSAPFVIAKGQDLMAQKIKKIAGDNNIPIVENKPLARLLYKSVDVNETIPQDLYQAVAEVLAYVYSLKKKKT